jgi:hypothetical protein
MIERRRFLRAGQGDREVWAMRALWLAAIAIVASSCGAAQRATERAGSPWYEVHFRGAALPAVRANGGPWHMGQSDNSSSLLGGLLGLAVGYPALGFAIGSAMVSDPTPEAPAPYVIVRIDGETYGISPIGRTLAPAWAQPIAIPAHRHRRDAEVLVQVRDAVDNGVLGQRTMRVDEFLRPGARTLTDVGDVASLDLDVRKAHGRPVAHYDFYVDARRSLEELADGGSETWRAVPVWNGDRVTVRASGSACPSGPSSCYGPTGAEPGRWSNYAYRGFEQVPHIALVGLLPGQPVAIGDGHTFIAERAGMLLLFVNDTDADNNEGGFRVNVEVVAP